MLIGLNNEGDGSRNRANTNCQYQLFFGLGNPGFKYKRTLHNAGFMVIDEVVKELGLRLNKKRYQSEYAVQCANEQMKIAYIKPQLYMNLSGECVEQFVKYIKSVKVEDIVIVYDDLETPIGNIVIEDRGACVNHRGLANIIERLGTEKIKRIKVGINSGYVSNEKKYILAKVGKEHKVEFEKGIHLAKEAVIFSTEHSFFKTMKVFNDHS